MDIKLKAKDIIFNKDELLTIFAGDSHTWGQGADGWETALKPSYVQAELRRLPEYIPSFVNLYSRYIQNLRKDKPATYVINSGYGCASTKKYLKDFWYQAVEIYKPDIIVLEFAINDWLEDRQVSLAEFEANLNTMIDRSNEIAAIPILLSVSPILGTLYSGDHYYQDYIDITRKIGCTRKDVLFADANKIMNDFLDKGDSKKNEAELFYDDWHVAQKGQELYLEAIISALGI